jgi:hypothetical protein
MKTILSLSLKDVKTFGLSVTILLFTFNSFSQNNGNNPNSGNNGQVPTQWKTNGNIADTNQFIGTTNIRPLVFKTEGSEKLRISTDGKVGIGTNTPESLLDVDGEVIIRGDIKLPNLGQLNNPNYDILFRDGTGTLKMGGIGQLTDLIYQPKDCGMGPIANPVWHNGENKIFSNCPQVKVGIGTIDPLYKLDVRGNAYFTGGMGLGIEPALSGAQLILKTQANREVGICVDQDVYAPYSYAYKAIVHDETTKGLGIYSELYGKDVFTVYSTGKIEVSNATGKILQLNSDGLLRARQIRVDTEVWPDYVFSSSYYLMPLSERVY